MQNKIPIMNSTIENSTLNTLTFTSKSNTMNSHYNKKNSSKNIAHPKKIKKTQSQKTINEKKVKSRNLSIPNIKKTKIKNNNINNMNNINLSSKYYVKSLRFAFINSNIIPINKQFANYNRNNIFNYNYPYKISSKKKKYSTYTSKNNSNINLKNRDSWNDLNCKNIVSKQQKITINKNLKNLNKLSLYEINKKVTKIQAYYRYYFARKKLYNTFLLYSRISKFFQILINKYIYYKHNFIKCLLNKKNKEIIPDKIKNIEKKEKQLKNKIEQYEICPINNIAFEQNLFIKNEFNNEKGNIINYTLCNINNININKIRENTDNKSFLEDRKRYEEKILQLVNENNLIKEKNDEFMKKEEMYKSIKLENEKLSENYNNINLEKDQLLSELNSTKEKYEKLLNDKQKACELNISKTLEFEIKINKEEESGAINYIEKSSEKKKFKDLDQKEKEKYLRNLFKTKVFEMRDYIHKCFIKFYYNGIFLQMTGKLKHLEKKKENEEKEDKSEVQHLSFISEKSSDNENVNENSNILNFEDDKTNEISTIIEKKSEEEIKEVKEIKEKKETPEDREKREKKERLQKSRGLRKIMAKKAKERLETLRVYFYKFYRAGIISRFRTIHKRKTCQIKTSNKFNLDSREEQKNSILNKNTLKIKSSKNLSKIEINEKEELKEKIVKALAKIIYKTDRRNMVILKKKFQKFYLKTKLESVQSIIVSDTRIRKKKKKKTKKKVKFSRACVSQEIDENILKGIMGENVIEEEDDEKKENDDN